MNLQVQGGKVILHGGGGAAFYGKGPSSGWAKLPTEKRNKCSVSASAAFKGGGYGSAGITSKDRIQWRDWEAAGMAGIGDGVAVMCGVSSVDFTRK